MNTDRIIELEIKVAYQDDLLQALNNAVSAQQQQIDRLHLTCQLLNERIKSVASTGSSDDLGANHYEIPPHY